MWRLLTEYVAIVDRICVVIVVNVVNTAGLRMAADVLT
jgi:hypothetical protein